MEKRSILRFGLAACALLAATTTAKAGTLYYATDLGFVGTAAAINSSGWVTGDYGSGKAFIYHDGQTDLVPSQGHTSAYATAINDAGQIAGGDTSDSYTQYAFAYGEGGLIYDLVANAWAWGFSDSFVVGDREVDGVGRMAFLEYNGTVTSLGTLPGDVMSEARGVNPSGEIVGCSYAQPASGSALIQRAFLYANGLMSALPTGSPSCAYAINSNGDVTGVSDHRPFVYHDGTVKYLAESGISGGEGQAINAAGDVVGRIDSRPFLYSGGVFTYLDTLVTNLGTSFLYDAAGINDSGQIAVTASVRTGTGYESHPFLLTPYETPEPGTALQSLLVLAVITLMRRYRAARSN